MGFFSDIFTGFSDPSTERKSTASNVVPFDLPGRSAEAVRRDIAACQSDDVTATQVSAAYAGAKVIGTGLAQVPCILQRRTKAGGREEATDHPLYDLLVRRPNAWMTSYEFREWQGMTAVIRGNAYTFVVRDAGGRPIELIPLAPGMVSVTSPTFGEVRYTLNVQGRPTYDQTNIWHLKGPSLDGLTGVSLTTAARSALGLSRDLEAFGSSLFSNGSRPGGLLSTENVLDAVQRAQLAESWNAQNAGIENASKTAILSHGLKFQPLTTSANEAQFIETRRFQIEEICRYIGIDPIMIQQSVNSASYGSIEQRFLAHMTHCLGPWHARYEQSAEVSLLSLKEQRAGYRVHMDNRSMLRGTTAERANYFALMKQNGFMSTNEIRDQEGLDRDPDAASDKLTPSANLYGTVPAPDPK